MRRPTFLLVLLALCVRLWCPAGNAKLALLMRLRSPAGQHSDYWKHVTCAALAFIFKLFRNFFLKNRYSAEVCPFWNILSNIFAYR